MTDVIIAPRVEDPLTDSEPVVSGAWFRLRPSQPYSAGGQWVLNVWPENVTYINGAAVTAKLDPLVDNPYELELTLPDGDGGYVTRTEYRIVTDSASPLKWEALELRNAPGTSPTPTSDFTAAIANLQAQIDTITNTGASNVTGVTGISVFSRTYLDDTSASAVRTTLGVPAVGDAPATHTHPVPSGLSATGTPSSSTFLRGDGAWAAPTGVTAAAVAWDDVTSKPTTFTPSTHSHAIADTTGLQTALDSKVAASGAVLTNPTANTPTAGDNSTKVATTAFVQGASAWAYGIYPRIVWSGSAWPTKASRTPAGYTGLFEYFSPYDASAPEPTDRATGDLWTRKRA